MKEIKVRVIFRKGDDIIVDYNDIVEGHFNYVAFARFSELEARGYVVIAQNISSGFKASNGEEIYENDFVKRGCLDKHCNIEHQGVVQYSTRWGRWQIDDADLRRKVQHGFLAPLVYGNPNDGTFLAVERLGNIYSNPELIK